MIMGCRQKPPDPILSDDGVLIELTQGYYALIDEEDLERVGQHIWSVHIKKHLRYAVSTFKGPGRTQMLMHQFVLDFPGRDIDHINHNGLDNRRINLRFADDKQNQANQQKTRRGTSKFKGVCRPTKGTSIKPWRASVMVNGMNTYIGSYKTEEEAALAYDAIAKKLRGDYAHLNLPGKSVPEHIEEYALSLLRRKREVSI